MTTIFSRRSAKSKGGLGSLGFGTSSSSKSNRYGTGISSSDFHGTSGSAEANGHDVSNTATTPASAPPGLSLSLPHSSDRPKLPAKSSAATGPSATQSPYADDFGRLTPTQTMPRNGARIAGVGGLTVPRGSEGGLSRQRTIDTNGSRRASPDPLLPLPAGTNATATASGKEAYPYGYTHEGWEIEITQATATQVVELCAKEIRARGLDSPLIFSSMALDLSASGVASLIKAFVASDPQDLEQSTLAQDVRYANPHNLAAFIKWTLARLGRFYAVPVPSQNPAKKGEVQEEVAVVQQRGWLDIEAYGAWRERERASDYPWTAFTQFCSLVDDDAGKLLRSLFSLLSSTTSYSLKNGMTPSKLARHFGVLLFGLPEDETFARTYESFIKASNATEHLFLAYIRDLAAFEVLPMRLMSHVDNYPLMLSHDTMKPAKHVRTLPVTQIERNVRFYSQDLIQSACEWELADPCEEWLACCLLAKGSGVEEPQLSDRFRKLVNLRGNGGLDRASSGKSNGQDKLKPSLPPSASDNISHHLPRHRSKSEDPASYTSVVDEQWGTFLNDGFAAPDSSKLAFDLHESERKARTQKRSTLAWSDFRDLGFDGPQDGTALSAVLSFDDGLREDMEKWPGERAELLDRIREQTKKAPPFKYDGRPRVIARPGDTETTDGRGETIFTHIDDVFAEVWADFLIGNGWSNRDEPTHRTANFVVLQYKSRSHAHSVEGQDAASSTSSSFSDDRSDAAWFVVQEIVPSDYRAELEAIGRSKGRSGSSVRKLNLFRRLRGGNKDKPTPSIPNSSSAKSSAGTTGSRIGASTAAGRASTSNTRPVKDDGDIDTLFPPGTKKLHLGQDPASRAAPSLDLERHSTTKSSKRGVNLFNTQMPGSGSSSAEEPVEGGSGSGGGFMTSLRGKASGMSIRHRLGGSSANDDAPAPPPPPKGSSTALSAGQPQNGGLKTTSSFGSADFDTHSFQDPDDHLAPKKEGDKKVKGLSAARSIVRHKPRQQSRDDSWVDVMTKSRMGDQDAVPLREVNVPRTAPIRTSSLIPESEDGVEEDQGGRGDTTPTMTISRSPARTPTQEQAAPFGPTSTSGATLKAATTPSPARTSPQCSSARKPAPEVDQLSPPRRQDAGSASFSRGSPSVKPTGAVASAPAGPTESTPPPSDGSRPSLSSSAATNSPSSLIESRFPTPPDRLSLISSSAAPADYRNSFVSTTDSEAGAEMIDFRIPKRTDLRSVNTSVDDAAKGEQSRQERVSAAVLRARELRAKLQPTGQSGGQTGRPVSPQDPAAPGSGAAKPKIDPFAKNPTSGKVASIAARFKEPSAGTRDVEGAMRPGGGTVKARAAAMAAAANAGNEAPATASGPPAVKTGPAGNKVASPSSSELTQAALARAAKNRSMMDPEQPPSPRRPDSMYGGAGSSVAGDHESLAPDDAASNYSRASSSDDPPGSSGALAGSGGTESNWGKVVTRQHGQQQALQSALLQQEGSQEDEAVETLDEDEDQRIAAREPYRPGQPLDNLLEESESQLSGTNSRM